jgi:NAD(P)-dependent dehydrogenase (short-subunit alcohol dehydrogenase family)
MRRNLPSNIAGMYAYSAELGACILINRKHPPERQRVSMLLEYGHFLLSSDRYRPGIDYLTIPGRKSASERFAEAFALCFLMPATSVRARSYDARVGMVDEEAWSSVCGVNIKGVFYCMKYEIEQMLKTGGGAIVNTSSIFGLNGYPGWSLYVATKHAVTGMTKAAALDYAKQNVRVNAVGPGPVETPLLTKGTDGDPHSYAAFVPMGRIGQPDEIADVVVWLLSDEARYVTGHTLPVDGGVCAQ